MRGAHAKVTHVERDFRIIPADAGSTPRSPAPFRPNWDHPRGCGEHAGMWMVMVRVLGSSPRMRGALVGLMGG